MRKITFCKDGTIEAGGSRVGTWHYVDVWQENGGKYDKSGNRLVRCFWKACLRDGKELTQYTQKELREAVGNWAKTFFKK